MTDKKKPAKKKIAGSGADISGSKQAEDALRESEAQKHAILNGITTNIALVDKELKILWANKAAADSVNRLAEDMVGHRCYSFWGDPARPCTDCPTHRAFQTGRSEHKIVHTPDGKIWEEGGEPVFDTAGNVIAVVEIAQDITERKRAEEELLANELKLDNALQSAQMGVWSLEIIENKRIFDDRVCRLMGIDPATFGGMAEEFFAAVHPDDREKIMTALTQTVEQDALYEPEYRAVWPDGSIHYICARGRLVRDDKGRPLRISGIVWDITDRKKVEKALKESEERFRYVLENVQDAVWSADLSGKFMYLSPLMAHIYGRPLEEMMNNPAFWIEAAYPEDQSAALASGEALSRDGHIELEYRIVRPDGTVRWILDRKTLIRDANGKSSRIAGVISDVTERKKTEEALKDSEEKYRMVVENAQEAIYIAVDGILKFGNNKAAELSGYTQEDLTSTPFVEFIHPDDREMVGDRYLRRLKGEDIPNIYSFRIIDRQGNIRWVELTAVIITWEGKPATLNFLTDVTDRRRLEDERQRVAKLESVGLLAGGIAHDFNNILTSILGNISLASMEAAPGSELQTSLEQAEKASLRAKDLTKQLLTFSKGGAPVKTLASLRELLRDTAGFALRGSNVKCHFSIPADLWHAEIDAGQVSQVIHNLVINAQQAMPTGGDIELTAENMGLSETQSSGRGLPLNAGNYVRISVADHGSGIPAKNMEKIFDPFFSTKLKGSGLGLATSFSIARQHGGHINVESEPGVGSTFYLYLPASTQKSFPEQNEKKATKPAGKARILVMDDEKGVREVAGRMLRHIGYEDVEFAKDGTEAIKLYKAAMESGRPFSVAILDLTIAGGMGGEVAIQKMLDIDPGVKAIVSSGYADDPVVAGYSDYGFSGVVAKPYTIAELRKAVQDVIG